MTKVEILRTAGHLFVVCTLALFVLVGCASAPVAPVAQAPQETQDQIACRALESTFTFEQDSREMLALGVKPFGTFVGEQAKRFVAATGGQDFPWFNQVKRVVIWTTPDNVYLVGVYNDACRIAAGMFQEEAVHGALRQVGFRIRGA
jgi:hypothetical protein